MLSGNSDSIIDGADMGRIDDGANDQSSSSVNQLFEFAGVVSEKFSKSRIIIFSIMAAFSAINFGYVLGHTGYYMEILKDMKIFDDNNKALYSSIVLLGAAFGSIFFGMVLLKKFGRRVCLLLCAIVSLVGWSLYFPIMSSSMRSKIDIPMLLYFSRFLNGIGLGAGTIASSVYIAEISPSRVYSITSTFHQIGIGLGFVLAFGLQFIVSEIEKIRGVKDHKYSIIVLPSFIFVIQILQTIFAFILPYSSSWLSEFGGKNITERDIRINTMKLYGCEYGLRENLLKMERKIDRYIFVLKSTPNLFFTPSTFKALFVGITMMFFQQFTGINPICFNAVTIIQSAGLEKNTLGSMIVGFSQLFGSIISIFVNRNIGTKKTLVFSSAIMSVVHIVIALYFSYWDKKAGVVYLVVILLLIYFIMFNISWGPIPYIINSCIYKPETVNVASGIANMFSWLFSFAISYPYFSIISLIGLNGLFYLFFGFSVVAMFFSIVFVPETRNKSNVELSTVYDRKLIHPKF